MLPRFSYVRPDSLNQALPLLGGAHSLLHAGGTDLLGCLHDRVLEPPAVIVSLSGVRELQGISATEEGSIRIGAMTTVAQLAASEEVQTSYPGLCQAAASVASPQLRNQGTVAGNLCQKSRCWYFRSEQHHCLRKGGDQCYGYGGESQYHCILGGDRCFMVHPSDLAPMLLALGAMVRIASPARRRVIPMDRLYVAPGDDPTRETVLAADEIITEIVLQAPAATLHTSYRKVRARAAWDFALVGVALALVMDDGVVLRAGVVLSGVAPVPWRATEVESLLTGKPLDESSLDAVCAAVVRGAEPLTHNAYKLPLLQGLLRDQLEAMT